MEEKAHETQARGSQDRERTPEDKVEAPPPDHTLDAPPDVLEEDALGDPVYAAKARVLNKAIQDIGMGRYQWQLFIVIGFGWASDNLWPITTSLILPPVASEFGPQRPPYLTLAQNIGLLIGAVFWGFGCDLFGRRWAFNLTIGITSIFGLIAAGSPNFAAICVFAALWSIGVGGNLPVDSAIFLEFLPSSHQYLLTVLSVDWALAQVFATLVAWPLIGHMTCEDDETCTKGRNMGWRYYMIVMGGVAMIMFFLRFVCFTIFESPKYLMGKGRDDEAVRVVHEVARRNRTTTWLTLDDLQACDRLAATTNTNNVAAPSAVQSANPVPSRKPTLMQTLKRSFAEVNYTHIRALFRTRKLALSTTLIILIWAFIGLGFPLYNAFLPYIQATRGASFGDGSVYLTYRNSLIIAVLGVPGCLLGGWLVERRALGRKGTLSLSTILTGVFLFASTTALRSDSLLGWNCAYNFCANVMYAVLYAYTPEVFPTRDRGTGNAVAAAANRVFGVMAPIVAMFADLKTSVPVYVSGALFVAAGLLVVGLPFESRGRASM
ncbi:MFS general substrate transporter [Sporormia fimetaria CBS 119925]|uniref:MFS general substrate transporter n=1 Tax=Sporormia fimetaria CBS 119925 TaxID=1340428 RepID=A0A6A6VEU0_9PLEO|nr:MFS general substrate transporter [Sporormia fimetaria CBS 119925]